MESPRRQNGSDGFVGVERATDLSEAEFGADGTSAIVLSGVDLIARLAAMVPPSRFQLLRYSGALAASCHRTT